MPRESSQTSAFPWKRTLVALFGLAVICVGVGWYFFRGKPKSPTVAVGSARESQAPRPAAPSRENGSTTESGKFVPEARVADIAVSREEAEARLREALKVEEVAPGKYRLGKVKIDAAARTASLPAKVNMRDGVIEYVLTSEKGKTHEALFTTSASPMDLHLGCLLLGMKGAPLLGDVGSGMPLKSAESVKVSVTWETNGPPTVRPLSSLMRLAKGSPADPGKSLPEGPWHYTGSRFLASGQFAAEAEGSLISLIRDGSALLNNPGPTRDNDELHLPNPDTLPPKGTPVDIILQLPNAT